MKSVKINKKATNTTAMNIFAVAGIIREKILSKNPDSSILELKTLGIVSKRKGITMSQLSNLLHISAPSTTEIANKLVIDHKLKRVPSKKDRRVVSIQITLQGKKTLEKTLSLASENIEQLLSKLTAKERSDFDKILDIIIRNK